MLPMWVSFSLPVTSGTTVTLDGDGRGFEEIAAEREVARS
jgi:hypothetical protein